MELINFAIDFGNGYVKAKSDKGEFIYSSKIARSSDLGYSSLDNEFTDDLDVNHFQRKDEDEYNFGADIENSFSNEQLITTNSNNNRYTLESFKRLVDFSLAELTSYEEETNIEVRLVTGVPSNEVKMKSKYDAFKDYLKGTHVVMRNGTELVINVKEVQVIEQPLGTLLNVYLNDKLQVHKTFKNGLIVVIDFGSGTTIIDIYKNMKRVGGSTTNEGMIQFHESIAESLSNELSMNVHAQYIEQGIKNKTFIAEFGNQAINFKSHFDNAIRRKVENTIQEYEKEITEETLVNNFIVTGGGGLIIGDQFKKHKPDFTIVENPQNSTVNGYFKLANKLRKE